MKNATTIDTILVFWPSGDTSIFEKVGVNQRITAVEHGDFMGKGACLKWDWNIHGHYYYSGDIRLLVGGKFMPAGLTVAAGTRIYAHKTFRTNLKPKISFGQAQHYSTGWEGTYLTTYGTSTNQVYFTSQYTPPASGNWTGLVIYDPDSLFLHYTNVTYATTGLYGSDYQYAPERFQITNSTFLGHTSAGVDLYQTAFKPKLFNRHRKFNISELFRLSYPNQA